MKWLAAVLILLPFLAGAQSKTDYKKAGAPIPAFSIVKPDGKTLTNRSLKPRKPVMLMIFSPTCDHCAHMIDTLKGLTANMQQTQLVLVTEARNKDQIRDFITKEELDKLPVFRNIGWDGGNLIYDIYTYQLLPQVNVYNESHKLIRSFTGAFSLDSLKQYIQ